MLTLVFLLIIPQLITAKSGVPTLDCPFKFKYQPPTQLNCNPLKYNRWKLIIACYVQSTLPIQYEIHWFQKYRNNTIKEHGRTMPVYYKNTNEEKGIFGQSWDGQDFRNDMLGDYWCQVKLTDREPPVYLSKSNILTVREPNYYNSSLPICDKKQYAIETECIGNSSLISSYSRTLSASPMASQIRSSILPTLTMQISSVSMATIELVKTTVSHLSATTVSRSKHLISSPTSTVTTENKNGMNIFLIGIVTLSIILVLVVLIFLIIILVVIITFKRKKMILLVVNQTNDETKRQENKNNTIITTEEHNGSFYPSQNPCYQSLTVTNRDYVSIYDNRNEGNIPSVRINEPSELPPQSQRNNELENDTDRTSINTTEPYYILLDESSLASYYTAQDPDGEIISIYDNVRSGVPMVNIKDHKYANINPSLVNNSVYTMRFPSHKTN